MTEDFNENSSAEKADENQKPAKHASSDRKTLESLARKIALTPIARQEPFTDPVEKAEHMTGREMMEAIEKTRKKKAGRTGSACISGRRRCVQKKVNFRFFPVSTPSVRGVASAACRSGDSVAGGHSQTIRRIMYAATGSNHARRDGCPSNDAARLSEAESK